MTAERLLLIITAGIFAVLAAQLAANSAYDRYAWSRDTKRMADIDELRDAFRRYREAHNGEFPPVVKETAFCLGVRNGQTCWAGGSLVKAPKGDGPLNEAIASYIKEIPADPRWRQGLGDAYLYVDGTLMNGCSSTAPRVPGHFLLWLPEKAVGGDLCREKGFPSCCGPSGELCGGPHHCAYQVD